ncbi:MAG: cobalamin biosynthesis protein [Nocardioidaceae bacterium]|nr:cobalamin biosynthesis protein [Nocardioidaceae bacterium]
MPRFPSRAAGLLLGFAADRLWGDPARMHPVAGFGRLAQGLERRMYANSRVRGVGFTAALVGSMSLAGSLAERTTRNHPATHTLATAVTTWAVLGGRSLEREATAVSALLADDDLPAARQRVTHLVGRDPSHLDESEIARATIESVAENTSDAVVAPLLAGALSGMGGLAAYRAANTLDAMVGHHGEQYENFGWASARLDDLLNLPGSRLSAGLAVAAAPLVSGSSRDAWRIWRRDAKHHPSPNAGPVEAAFAGALDVTLGGVNSYDGRVEDRHTLGDGPEATPDDIARATRLALAVGLGAAVVAALASRTRPLR